MKNLYAKALGGFARITLALAFLIFLPAWTLKYTQGWVYLSCFSFSVLFITLFFLKHDSGLIERRVNAGPAAEKKKSQKIIQSLASVFVIMLVGVSSFDYGAGWTNVAVFFSLISDAMVVSGLMIVFRVFRENSYTKAIIDVEDEQKLVTTGPYEIVRHPMYSGALIIFFFTPPALGSMAGIIFSFPLTAALIARLLDEEKYLRKNLPGYNEYCLKTKYRLIPHVW